MVDSVRGSNACWRAAFAQSSCALRINVMTRWRPMWSPPSRWGVATTRACLSTTTGDWPLSTGRTVCIWVRRTRNNGPERYPGRWIKTGVSTHDDMEIDVALAARPSYIALGHVFPTQTKQMPSAPQGLTQLAAHVKRLADYPTVAIGQPGTRSCRAGYRCRQYRCRQRHYPAAGRHRTAVKAGRSRR